MDEQEKRSVSIWVNNLKGGDADAAQQLWGRYFQKLVKQAQAKLRDCPPQGTDAEDIAVSVFESLWRGSQEGRFEDVRNRDELWWLLLAITRHKVANHVRKESAQKRGGQSVPKRLGDNNDPGYSFEELVSAEPTPEYLLQLQEEYSRALALLRDDRLRQIAALKLEGYTTEEISNELTISAATVTRKLRLIRATWERELDL